MMKTLRLYITLSIAFLSFGTFATNWPFANTAITIGDNTGCAVTNYTLVQENPNKSDGNTLLGATVTITFPAGVNLTTATMAGSSFNGLAITSGWSIVGQTVTFSAPVAVAKKKTITIVIANITNPDNMNSTATSVSIVNSSGDLNSATSYPTIITTPCPVVPPNNECTGAISLTPAPAGSGTCTTTSGTTYGATASAQTVCTGQADDDVWYSFVANSSTHQVTVDGVANFNAVVQVFAVSCAGASLVCTNATGTDGIETSSLTGLIPGTTYFVRVYHSGVGAGVLASNSFTICVTSTVPGCSLGAGNLLGVSLPYSSGAQTTCGAGNDITSSNSSVCGSSSYYSGEDKVISFTPGASGNISINLTSSGSWVGVTLYEGCPTTGGSCVAYSQSSSGNQSIGCAPVTAGLTYYLVVDSYPSPTCNPFSVTISAPTGGIPPGTTCGNPLVMTLPYSATAESTLCFGNDYSNASPGSCGTLYESGEDKVYEFTTTGPDCFSLALTNASTSYIGYQIYQGCPSSGGAVCIANGGGASSGILNGSFTVPSAGTYYLVVDTYASPSFVNYDISLISLGSGPANDLPCNATPMTLGVIASGDNNCTGSSGEPTIPGGWTTGSANTVWYSVVIPASGSIKVKTIVGSLTNTQIAAYTGTCGPGLTFVSSNNDVGYCGSTTDYTSQLTITGTAGSTVYIRVDGENDLTGDFGILAIDGTTSFPGVQGQDCSQPNPVCNSYMTISNPGYSGNGNICDIPSSGYCLASGERNVVWYRVPISTAGTFRFNIVPNDFDYAIESETDYDFAVWQTGSTVGDPVYTCDQIASGTAPPAACNYSYLGVTGVGITTNLSTNVCPSCPGGYNPSTYSGAYTPTINAVAGDEYLIAVSNFSSSTSGFRIEFTGTAVIDFAQAVATAEVYWTGGDAVSATEWNDADNWGGCSVPSCSRDAFISALANQPILLTGQVYDVRNLTIQPGAVLTLQPNATLRVCGDFINYGTLTADPTSTIVFVGPSNEIIAGNLSGTSKFGNLTVTKGVSSGTVTLNNNIEIGGSFTTSNSTSIFNSNNKYIKLAGDFVNNNGNSTYTNTGTLGTLEFNGSGLQNYNQGASQLDLNFVLVNNSAGLGSGVTLSSNMFVKTTTGTLTLDLGTITTNTNRVEVNNTALTSVTPGNTTSFVDGNLRRYLLASGGYNWPVGNVSKGYQLVYTNFASNANTYIDARFDLWPFAEPIQGGGVECNVTYSLEAMNNGYWTMTATPNGAAIYNMIAYPTNVTNIYAGWTIMKRSAIAPMPGWLLDGTCDGSSTAAAVKRNGMSGFSVFGIAQSPTPLPIELLEFTGEMIGEDNLLKWITSSEHNNDYFTVEQSYDGIDFREIGTVTAAGNTIVETSYQLYDYSPRMGVNYYRLKQTDIDGAYSYSKTIALNRAQTFIEISELYPNPTNADVSFEVNSPISGEMEFNMYDNSGRLIRTENLQVVAGVNAYHIPLSELATGVYTVLINSKMLEQKEIRQLIKR